MNVEKLLHKLVSKSSSSLHKSRIKALSVNVDSLLHGQRLSVTGLGRASRRQIAAKHAIKQSDRLVGNAHLFAERLEFYRALCHQLIHHKHPRILIDWSDLSDDRAWVILRASLVMDGRAITLFEQVHQLKNYGNRKKQHQFLTQLAELLPHDCQPIIITDAGFLVPWFKAVEALGWYWVGRLRSNIMIRSDQNQWVKGQELHNQATRRVKSIMSTHIAQSNPIKAHVYYQKEPAKHRKYRTKLGNIARSRHSLKNARRGSQPYLIATNLPTQKASPRNVIALYKTRMQIEESFRDMKSHQFGFSLRYSKTRDKQRLCNLLLIAMLASFILYIIGLLAEKNKQHLKFQANTIRQRRVLSLAYRALQVIKRPSFKLTLKQWLQGINLLKSITLYELI